MNNFIKIHNYYLAPETSQSQETLNELKDFGIRTLSTIDDESILFKIESSKYACYDKITELTRQDIEQLKSKPSAQLQRRFLYFTEKKYAEMMLCLMIEWTAVTDNIFDDYGAAADILDDYKTMVNNSR